MLEMPKLYKDVYDKPFVLAPEILQQIGDREKVNGITLQLIVPV